MRTLLPVVISLALAGAAFAQRQTLEIGHSAPPLEIETWVNGDPVQMTPEGTYVVVFWQKAGAKGAGDRSTERLERMADYFAVKGLNIIVVYPDKQEDLFKELPGKTPVTGFVYGIDNRGRSKRAWVTAAKIKDYPVAFIVGKGKIMHIGNPGDADFRSIIVQVITGRYDPKLQDEASARLEAARRARKFKNWRMAMKSYDEVIALDERVFAIVALERFEMMLVDMADEQAAYDYARKLITETFSRDPGALQMLAIQIALDPDLDEVSRDLDVALRAAKQSVELEGQRDPDALATAALVHFHRGEVQDAVSLQTRAYFQARPKEKPEFRRVLDSYRDAAKRSGARAGSSSRP